MKFPEIYRQLSKKFFRSLFIPRAVRECNKPVSTLAEIIVKPSNTKVSYVSASVI
jgi:hypothetical protein